MPFPFEKWPFTNFHDLNLDWVLNTMKEYVAQIEAALGEVESMKAQVQTNTADIATNKANIAANSAAIAALQTQAATILADIEDLQGSQAATETDLQNLAQDVQTLTNKVNALTGVDITVTNPDTSTSDTLQNVLNYIWANAGGGGGGGTVDQTARDAAAAAMSAAEGAQSTANQAQTTANQALAQATQGDVEKILVGTFNIDAGYSGDIQSAPFSINVAEKIPFALLVEVDMTSFYGEQGLYLVSSDSDTLGFPYELATYVANFSGTTKYRLFLPLTYAHVQGNGSTVLSSISGVPGDTYTHHAIISGNTMSGILKWKNQNGVYKLQATVKIWALA